MGSHVPALARAILLTAAALGTGALVVGAIPLGLALAELRRPPTELAATPEHGRALAPASASLGPRLPESLGPAPDAGTVIFQDGFSVWRYEGASGALERLGAPALSAPHVDGRRHYVKWSSQPTGSWGDMLVDARTGERQILPFWQQFRWVDRADVSPDRRSIAYVAARELSVSVDGAPPRLLPAATNVLDVLWSPDGKKLLVEHCVTCGALIGHSELWLVDPTSGAARRLYEPPEPRNVTLVDRSSRQIIGTFTVHSWSPDSRYVLGWERALTGASYDIVRNEAMGVFANAIDTVSGQVVRNVGFQPLVASWRSPTSWLAWKPPHTLVSVSAKGDETWWHTGLQLWSPETGGRRLDPDGRALRTPLSPSWDRTRERLFLVDRGSSVPIQAEYFAGLGHDDGRIAVYELSTGVAQALPQPDGYADLGVRVSEDGQQLLVLRRRVAAGSRVELWSARSDGSHQRPLVRLTLPTPYYVGFYPHLDQVAWSR